MTLPSLIINESHLTVWPPRGLHPGSEKQNAAAVECCPMFGHDETVGSSHTSHRNHTLATDRNRKANYLSIEISKDGDKASFNSKKKR